MRTGILREGIRMQMTWRWYIPGWEPERMAKLDELLKKYRPVTKEMRSPPPLFL